MTILNTDHLKKDYFLDDLNNVKFQVRVSEDGGKWIDWDSSIEELNDADMWLGNIRIKPIKEFEIGDWVCDINSIINRDIKIITKDLINYYNGTNYMAQERYKKHWFPQEDEYMWFYNSYNDYHFGQFLKSISTGKSTFFYSKEFPNMSYTNIEPFTKQIPLFLKGE